MTIVKQRIRVIDTTREAPGSIADVAERAGVDIAVAAATLQALCERGLARGVLHGGTMASAVYSMKNTRRAAAKLAAELDEVIEVAA